MGVKTLLLAAALCLLPSACAESTLPDAPVVRIVVADDVPRGPVMSGATPWLALGFTVEWPASVDEALADESLPWCLGWRVGDDPACAVPVLVQHEDATGDEVGHADGGLVTLDARLDAFTIAAVAAHELGHVLLGDAHLAPGEYGVMSADLRAPGRLTEADLALACSAIGLCI